MVLSEIVFAGIAILTVGSALMLFMLKKLIHAVVCITLAFIGAALMMLFLGQSLFALLLMLVFIGGISTYLVVAVATEEKKAVMINQKLFIGAVTVFTLTMAISILPQVAAPQTLPAQTGMADLLSQFIQGQYLILYLLVLLLFSTVIGGILVMRKFAKLLI
ncbi:MAG: hypothetical protein KGH72_05100 [Candidatus Micrarchaeota archaeon]|nr:hypothetical protein [Candidatus Micrarchaeota archaeon]